MAEASSGDRLRDDLGDRLERAVTEWEAQAADAYEALLNHLAETRSRLDVLAREAAARKDASLASAKALAAELGTLKKSLNGQRKVAEEDRQRAGRLEQSLAEHTEALRVAKQRASQLEKALEEQQKALAAAQEQLTQQERTFAEQTDAAQAARRRIIELERELEASSQATKAAAGRVVDLEQALSSLRAELDAARSRAQEAGGAQQELAAETSRLRADLNKAREDIEVLRREMELKVETARQLEVERSRADRLEEQLRQETGKGTKAMIAQQLAEALQELEEARRQVAALHAELEALRNKMPESAPCPDAVNVEDHSMPRKVRRGRETPIRQLGEMLVRGGIISQEQLEAAQEQLSRSPHRSAAEVFVERGLASEEVVSQALACQQGVLFVSLDDKTLDPAAARLIPERIVKRHGCIAIRATQDAVVLAMADPLNVIAIQDVERFTGRSVQPVVATPTAIAAAVTRWYSNYAGAGSGS